MTNRSPGDQFESLWMKLQRALAPWNLMLAQRKVTRQESLHVIADARAILAEMEVLINGERK